MLVHSVEEDETSQTALRYLCIVSSCTLGFDCEDHIRRHLLTHFPVLEEEPIELDNFVARCDVKDEFARGKGGNLSGRAAPDKLRQPPSS